MVLAVCAATLQGAASSPTAVAGEGGPSPGWPVAGHDLANSRSNPAETTINVSNAGSLAVKWTIPLRGEVSSTPAVVGDAVYITDWAGYLTRADARTGQVVWSRNVAEYTGVQRNISRTTPAVSGGLVFIGDQGGPVEAGARVLAVDADTGDLVWNKVVDDHPKAQITQSPVVHNGVVYQGTSSAEEEAATDPGYPCCTFRGSVIALDSATGRTKWRTYTVPENDGRAGGYSGVAVWSGTPAIDPARGRLYVTTGNNYTVPQEAKDCQEAGGTPGECLSPDDHLNSIVAMDLGTGAVEWSSGPQRFDDWNGGCLPGYPPDNCPQNPGADWDFADGPHLFSAKIDGRDRRLVGAGQKSGEFWTVDADTGEIVWSAAAGPGGYLGGIEWGSATDGKRIYIAEANSQHLEHTLPDGRTITSGSFGALDPATGRILWQVPDPSANVDTAAITTANGVVYAGSLSGHMYALNAATGQVLWDFQGQAQSNAGPAVVNGVVYWGNGYPDRFQMPSPPNPSTFYAFSLNGR